jgi:hypothetical protein
MRLLSGFVIGFAAAGLPSAAGAQFETHTVATELRFGYQVRIADINNDGRPDLVGLGAQMTDLLWFENPTWEAHVLTSEAPRMINLDAADIDGDGIPEIALAYGFSTLGSRSSGELAILRSNGDPTEPWTLTEIDAIPTAHRVRFADADDSGTPVLINAPIVHTDAVSQADPDRLPTPLVYYRPGEWERRTITDQNLGAMHGLLIWDTDGDGTDEVLSAGRMGIHAHHLESDGSWTRTELSVGVPEPYPDGGSSDVANGMLNGEPFFAAIEPFHGNQVVVYRGGDGNGWDRLVIDTELANGHTIVVADFNGDGNGEIVAAGTRDPQNLYLYRATDEAGSRWERTIIDDAISGNSCDAADINGDGRIDVACINSRAPNELKWYENTGQW